MKIPTIRQLPSGSYFCRLRVGGRDICITEQDYDKCYAKAVAMKAGVIKAKNEPQSLTVGEALSRYIDNRRDILSPSTLAGYEKIKRLRFGRLQTVKICALSRSVIQREINREASQIAPKSLKNAVSLVLSAIAESGGERYDVSLPKIPPKEKTFLTPEQIKILCAEIKGDRWEIPILLGLWSCRRSEILALRWEDIDLAEKVVHIRRGMVADGRGKLVEKAMPKTTASVRDLPMCTQLFEVLSAVPVEGRTGYVCPRYAHGLYKAVNAICAKHKWPPIGAHGLRHSFASLCYAQRVPAKTARLIGGWENDAVMINIYTHLSDREKSEARAALTAFFDA